MTAPSRAAFAVALCLLPWTAAAQEDPAAQEKAVSAGSGAVLRTLDRIEGQTRDIELRAGESARLDRMQVRLRECRYPTDNPSGEAYAYLTIREDAGTEPVFSGWLVASSPALNPLDHPRYDVWVLRCTTS